MVWNIDRLLCENQIAHIGVVKVIEMNQPQAYRELNFYA